MLALRRASRALRLRGGSSRYRNVHGSMNSVLCGAFMAGILVSTNVEARCEAPAALATCALAVTPTANDKGGMMSRYWEWVKWNLRVLLRSLYLTLNYCLPVAAAPVAFLACDSDHRHWWWALLRDCIRRAGPCSTKMAQWIATRPDLFDLEAVHELSVLQANAYRHNERALVDVLSETFKHCDGMLDVTLDSDSMLGSGSVASVYRGKLRRRSANGREDGAEEMEEEDVAVKMIHPEVRDSIKADLRVMRSCVSFFTGILPFDPVSLADSMEQFASLMQDQLDMRTEARNLDRFNEAFKDHHHIFFPVPVPGWVSENVLVESYEEGPPVSDFLSFPPAQPHPKVGTDADRLQLAQLGLEAVLRMVFEHNFVHADLHPGNVIVRGQKDGGSSKDLSFVMIDAGITASLHSSDRRNFIELFRAVVLNDGRHAGHLIMKRSMLGLEGCLDPEGFEKKLAVVIDECHKKGLSLGRLGVAELLTRVLTLCYQHRVRLDPTFTQLVLGIVVVDGLGRRLDADIDILQACGPHVLRAAANFARGGE